MMCEKCWGDAYMKSRLSGRDQVDIYRELIRERECTPKQQSGDYWDEENQCDGRAMSEVE